MTYRYRSGVRSLTYDARDNNSTATRYVKNQGNFSASDASQDFASGAGFVDPLDPSTFLLLQADGFANGSTNNTYLDSSSNNATFTTNGTPTQGSFSPYANGWSVQFPYNAYSYINIADTTELRLENFNFTIEAWVYPLSRHNGTVYGQWSGASGNDAFMLYLRNDGYFEFMFRDNVNVLYQVTTASIQYAPSNWYHFAVVRNGSNISIYINGRQSASTTFTGYVGNTSNVRPYRIGSFFSGPPSYFEFNGYISNVRQVIGTAVYTSNFNVPTGPLQAISGTKLLLGNIAYLKNFGTTDTPLVITTVNGPKATRFSPFPGGTTGAGATTNSGSVRLAGGTGGDYLSTINSSVQATFTSSATIQFWMYPAAAPTVNDTFIFSSGPSASGFGISININLTLRIYTAGLTSASFVTGTSAPVYRNFWNHIALVKNGSTVRVYINGVLDAGSASASSMGGFNGTNGFLLGARSQDPTSFDTFNGYISNFSFSVGTALYTADFTPPSRAIGTTAETRLLANCTNAAAYDAASNFNFKTIGSAQVSTSVVKYGSGALFFNGTTSWLISPEDTLYALNDNFTIECWINLSSVGTLRGIAGSGLLSVPIGWKLEVTASNYLQYTDGASAITGSTAALAANTWYHVAVVRQRPRANGAAVVLYLNGNVVATAGAGIGQSLFNSGNYYPLYIGAGWSAANPFAGYIDDFRISQTARYQGPFTPPPRGYPPQ